MSQHEIHINDILREVAEKQASDLYLVTGAVPCISVQGHYLPVEVFGGRRLSPDDMSVYARQMMSDKQWKEFEETMEMNLAYMAGPAGRFRVNVYVQRGSIGMVCRRVVMDIPTMRSLGLPPELRDVALADRGIVLVTGATGSGKSTSLASMIDYRAHIRSGHIITIEDPVEFVYRHRRSIVTQREVGIDTQSFHAALKNTLRQAPQVICIGEMRDAETVQFAMHASETGHLVFGTLHATNTTLALDRILHFYPGELKEQIQEQLAVNLNCILSQRLVPCTRGGRIAAHEVLLGTPRVRDLVVRGDLGEIRVALSGENPYGLQSFDKSLYKLHRRGMITYEDALQNAESANDLAIKFKGIGLDLGGSWEDTGDPWEFIEDDYIPPSTSLFATKLHDPNAMGSYNNAAAAPLATTEKLIPLAAVTPGYPAPLPPSGGQFRPSPPPTTQPRPPMAPRPAMAPHPLSSPTPRPISGNPPPMSRTPAPAPDGAPGTVKFPIFQKPPPGSVPEGRPRPPRPPQ